VRVLWGEPRGGGGGGKKLKKMATEACLMHN
jgi:hypothetical protein